MTNTKDLTKKKLFGTAFFVLFVLGVALSASSSVQALFVNTKKALTVDGIVTSVGASDITVGTAGSLDITFDIDKKTIFLSGLALNDFASGDHVRIAAKTKNGKNPLALIIQKLKFDDPGYGTQGDTVLVEKASVIGKTADTFTVDSKSTITTFKVLTSTYFVGGNFSSLKINDKVMVNGEDNTTEFIARVVVIQGGGNK